jgi:hypothetical protein
VRSTERDLERLLSEAHAAASPRPEERLRALQRLEAGIEPLALVPALALLRSGASGAAGSLVAPAAAPIAGTLKWVVSGLLMGALGVALGFVLGRSSAPAAAALTSVAAPPAPAALPAELPLGPPPERSAPVLMPEPATAQSSATLDSPPQLPRARAASPRTQPAKPSDAAADLREALRLLRQAQQALRDQDGAGALKLLDVLDERVAVELLTQERQVARVLAWCLAGEPERARVLAQSVLQSDPDSVYAGRINNSCVGEPLSRGALLEEMRRRAPK